ncbi:MAG: hypothetical protein ND895_15850, partial [Pyrinomonadaceae bacterium]|nr:hypothetical protein [Pyrinomonadaceae bacterium]
DAAGDLVTTSEIRNGQTKTMSLAYDGDGKLLYESVNGTTSDYLIRSTVLGTVLTKLTATGGKDITYVPANGLVAPMQNENPGFTPFMSWVQRDALGVQERQSNAADNVKAYDPFGGLIPNTQPPLGGGPPPYVPFYGATYGGVTLSAFITANNLSSGCYSATSGAPDTCSNAMLQRMSWEFVSNLPGFSGNQVKAEDEHAFNYRRATGSFRQFDDNGRSYFNHAIRNGLFNEEEAEPQNTTGIGVFPWITSIHNSIIDGIAPCLTLRERRQMKTASADVDEDQSLDGSYKHAMRAPGQSVYDAYLSSTLFIFEAVLGARELQQDYAANGGKGFSPDALYAVGIAIHTVTDSTSPAHTGFQVWHGLDGPINLIRAARHGVLESEITPAQQTEAVNKGREIFRMAFGLKLSATAFPSKSGKCVGNKGSRSLN